MWYPCDEINDNTGKQIKISYFIDIYWEFINFLEKNYFL